jgi:O-acetylhomoserine (thiol)-lyase
MPVCQTTSFVFEDSPYAADLFALRRYRNHLQPHRQPGVRRLRGADGQLGGRHRRGRDPHQQAGGGALLTCTALAAVGDNLVASAALDGGTHALQDVSLRRPGMDTTFVPVGRSEALAVAMRPAPKAFSHTGAVRGLVFGVAVGRLSQVI